MLLPHKALVFRHNYTHLVRRLVELRLCLQRRLTAYILRLLGRCLNREFGIALRSRRHIFGGLLRHRECLAHTLLDASKILNRLPRPREIRTQTLLLVNHIGIVLHDLV